MTKQERLALEGLRAYLASMADPNHDGLCAIPTQAKIDSRLFLQSWILPVLDALVTQPSARTHWMKQTMVDAAGVRHRARDTAWRRSARGARPARPAARHAQLPG